MNFYRGLFCALLASIALWIILIIWGMTIWR